MNKVADAKKIIDKAPAARFGVRMAEVWVEFTDEDGNTGALCVRQLSSAQVAWLRGKYKPGKNAYQADLAALRMAICNSRNIDLEGIGALELRFEDIEIWGKRYSQISSCQWEKLVHALEQWMVDDLNETVYQQNYLSPAEKKSLNSTLGLLSGISSATSNDPESAESAESEPATPAAEGPPIAPAGL